MNYTLESHKFFPYIAWSLVVFFAVFTFMLTMKVKEDISNIAIGTAQIKQNIDTYDSSAKPVRKTR